MENGGYDLGVRVQGRDELNGGGPPAGDDAVDTPSLVRSLSESYTLQLELYRELEELDNRILSRMVLSRGDVGGSLPHFERKRHLLEQITNERERMGGSVDVWMRRKAAAAQTPEVANLNGLLERIESSIRNFLSIEDQLRKYLEHIVNKKDRGPQ
jgi:hypothetical protein